MAFKILETLKFKFFVTDSKLVEKISNRLNPSFKLE